MQPLSSNYRRMSGENNVSMRKWPHTILPFSFPVLLLRCWWRMAMGESRLSVLFVCFNWNVRLSVWLVNAESIQHREGLQFVLELTKNYFRTEHRLPSTDPEWQDFWCLLQYNVKMWKSELTSNIHWWHGWDKINSCYFELTVSATPGGSRSCSGVKSRRMNIGAEIYR